jgi:hypothetical protein
VNENKPSLYKNYTIVIAFKTGIDTGITGFEVSNTEIPVLKKCFGIGCTKINRKFRVPRKQGAHFLGARAQIQDPWVFIISMKFPIDRVPSCLIFGTWDFGRIREQATCAADHDNVPLNFPRAKTFQTSPHMFNLRQRNPSYT